MYRAFRRADMRSHINQNPRVKKASAQGRRPEARTAQGAEWLSITEKGRFSNEIILSPQNKALKPELCAFYALRNGL